VFPTVLPIAAVVHFGDRTTKAQKVAEHLMITMGSLPPCCRCQACYIMCWRTGRKCCRMDKHLQSFTD